MKNCLKSSLSSKAAGASLNVLTFHLMSCGSPHPGSWLHRFNSEPPTVTLLYQMVSWELNLKEEFLLQVSSFQNAF